MAQKQLDRFDSPDPVSASLNYNHPTTLRESMNYYQSITESQDATDLELACLDQEKPATKEDLAHGHSRWEHQQSDESRQRNQ